MTDADEVVADFLLREGVVDGLRLSIDDLAKTLGVTKAAVRRKIERTRTALLDRYGLDPEDALAFELVKSLESVRRASADLELVMHSLRGRLAIVAGTPDADALSGQLAEAVSVQSRLARQRDGLLLKLKQEGRREKERRDREPQARPISISVNGAPLT